MAELPDPDPDARAHSERLARVIRGAIVDAGGWIPFADYMQLALYAPGLGYYAAGAAKLGAAGDFVTAPELTPLYGAALAVQIAAILRGTGAREVVEVGAGTGRLAASVLDALARAKTLPERYRILEPSPELRARQEHLLGGRPWSHRVEWIAELPDAIDGAVLANEVLDALPVHVLQRRGNAVSELGASIGGEPVAPRYGLAWMPAPARSDLAQLADARFPAEIDYTSEINPRAEALVREIARRLRTGAALFVDYGFPAREYYHPQRSTGTLVCHYRHQVHADPFFHPGLCDITAHVDFTAIASAGAAEGLKVAGFTSQATFLLGCGILERLAEIGAPESAAYIKAASAVQRLLSPAEMGELFKVLALTRSVDLDWPGLALARGGPRL